MANTQNNGPIGIEGRKLLIVTDARVWSPGEGRNYRFLGLVSGLSRCGMEIDFITSRPYLEPDAAASLRSAGISKILTGENSRSREKKQGIRSTIRRRCPRSIAKALRSIYYSPREIQKRFVSKSSRIPGLSELRSPLLPKLVEDYTRMHAPDFILVEYLMYAYALDCLKHLPEKTRPVTMIDTHDVVYQRHETLCRHGFSLPFRITREEETKILKNFDIVIAIQDDDKKAFEDMLPGRTVVTCLPAFSSDFIRSEQDRQAKTVMFIGGDYLPNNEGLRQFLGQAWPLVLQVHPKAVLNVYGNVCRHFQGESHSGVSFKGYIQNPQMAYLKADIVISPVTFGSGLKIKVLEALGYGCPVIATPHSAIGFTDAVGRGLFIAPEWKSFAEVIISLFHDPERIPALSRASSDYAAQRFNRILVMNDLFVVMGERTRLNQSLTDPHREAFI